jgi:protein-tyrosine phosphatase
LKFLTFYWVDDDRQLIFDEEDQVPKEIVRFIDESLSQGFSVLIHSMRGQSRASVVAILYFMEKFQWSLLKTLEFINSRRPDLEIRANFL